MSLSRGRFTGSFLYYWPVTLYSTAALGLASHHPRAEEANDAGGICYPSGGGSLVQFTDKNSNTRVMDITQNQESWGVSWGETWNYFNWTTMEERHWWRWRWIGSSLGIVSGCGGFGGTKGASAIHDPLLKVASQKSIFRTDCLGSPHWDCQLIV